MVNDMLTLLIQAEENIELWKKLQAQQELVQKRDQTVKEMQAAMEAMQEQQRQMTEKLDAQIATAKHQVCEANGERERETFFCLTFMKELLVAEYTRRTQVLSVCLEDMAQENIALTTKLAAAQGLSRDELAQKLQQFSLPLDQKVADKGTADNNSGADVKFILISPLNSLLSLSLSLALLIPFYFVFMSLYSSLMYASRPTPGGRVS